MGGGSSTPKCRQDSRVSMVCPLDLDQKCQTNIYGSVNRNSDKTTNFGLVNWSWVHKMDGGSFILGLCAGIILTALIIYFYNRRKKRKREATSRSRRGRSASIFRRRRRRDPEEGDPEEESQPRGWRLPRPSWPQWPTVSWQAAAQPALPQPPQAQALVPATQAVASYQPPAPNPNPPQPAMSYST